MNAQQLKNAILQEAIEGRLVPQDPNDEPASVLLARIRKEKERLMKEGKLKKKDLEVKPISEDEIPFGIPESWEWCRLKDIVLFLGGYAYDSTSFISSSNNQVLRLGNVKNDNIILNINPVFIDDKLAQDTDKYKCKENDILITMTGTRKKRDYFFSVLVNSSHQNLYINQRVGCLRSIEENIAKWLVIVLKTEVILTDVFQYETGTANQGNLGAENILKTKIPLPPLAEQHRIVAKIEELLPKVEEYGKAQEALNKLNAELPERLKKSILQEAIEGRLVPQDPNDEPASVLLAKIHKEKEQLVKAGKLKKKDLEVKPISEDEIPFEIPKSWEWCKLGAIVTLIGGFAFKSHEYTSTGSRVIRISDITENGFINKNVVRYPFNDKLSQYVILEGDILMAMTGGTVGKSLYVKYLPEETMLLNQRVAIIRVNTVFPDYIDNVIKSQHIQSIITEAKNSTNDNISMGDIYNFPIPLPPLAEQKRIVAKIEQILGEIDKLKT